MACNRQMQDGCTQDKNFFHIVNQIQRVHAKFPELRLCQLLSIAANKAGWDQDDLFYLEDETLFRGLMNM